MTLRTISTRIFLGAIGLLAAAAPSYAGWGAFSGVAVAAKNQSVVCTYQSVYIGVLRASRNYLTLDNFGTITFDDAVFTNLAATANVWLIGNDSKVPTTSWLPIMYVQNAVKTNQALDFATVTNENFFDTYNLQAGCMVGN